ncbi:alpha/beta fold hydrolase [Spartinivicinus poritis]|uniref:Alpha/beta hydrolase n=1 Tax=Spartinivicinus poritis TaxID=2994640 RepID=A0ABT5U3G2_9GAMM|nr:alpha/beta hydrolase [Spartinivicinus sp. A2-2]MDE1460914.1 alpha/beta hydrolase [Spartinivicinus sp. A2-2]
MTQSLLKKALTQYASDKPETTEDPFAPQFISVGKYKIRYTHKEKPLAPTLLLLNGLPQSIRMWESSIEAFSDNFDVLAFDIPGFGLSRANEADMSPSNLSEVIIQVMDHFNIEQAHLVGPDVGVPIALTAVINHPQRFLSLNIFDGPGSYPPKLSPILMAVIKSRFVRWLAKGLNRKPVMKTNFLTAVNEGYHHYKPTKRAVKEYYDIAYDDQAHKCAISFFGTYSKELPWIEQRLKEIKVPTLITWGKQDPFVLVENAEFLAKYIPNNKLVIFENASHFPSEDAGQDYVDLLIDWIEGSCMHKTE